MLKIYKVFDFARIYGHAKVFENAEIFGFAAGEKIEKSNDNSWITLEKKDGIYYVFGGGTLGKKIFQVFKEREEAIKYLNYSILAVIN